MESPNASSSSSLDQSHQNQSPSRPDFSTPMTSSRPSFRTTEPYKKAVTSTTYIRPSNSIEPTHSTQSLSIPWHSTIISISHTTHRINDNNETHETNEHTTPTFTSRNILAYPMYIIPQPTHTHNLIFQFSLDGEQINDDKGRSEKSSERFGMIDIKKKLLIEKIGDGAHS